LHTGWVIPFTLYIKEPYIFAKEPYIVKNPIPCTLCVKDPQYFYTKHNLYLCIRALFFCTRALHLCKRALYGGIHTALPIPSALNIKEPCISAPSNKRARYLCKRVLYLCKQALHLCKKALYLCKRALYLCKRALYLCKGALCLCKRAFYLCKRDLYHHESLQRSPLSLPKSPVSFSQSLTTAFFLQSLQIRIANVYSVSLRFYNAKERRIASSWQFVPVYTQKINSSFLAMRTLREYA